MPRCRACNHANTKRANYCAHCGASLRSGELAVVEERRYCTVLFCDLVDSSTMSGELGAEDYADVLRSVHECSATIVDRYDGTVSQFLGDGILVLFGYPHAHEDDAARAVQAALEMQSAISACAARTGNPVRRPVPRLHSRAAIHTGVVVIRKMGASEQASVLALGDAVNIAANLQALAAPDALLITEGTRRLLGGRFDLQGQGPTHIRGFPVPVETFRVTGIRAMARRHDAGRRGELTPLIGRAEELARITARWEQVVAGHGQTILISGDPGIGKSRLAVAARHALAVERWVEFHGSQYSESSELRPILEMLEGRILRDSGTGDARQRLARELEAAGPGGDEVITLLSSLLSLPETAEDRPVALLPAVQRRRMVDTLADWIWGISGNEPAVIVFEDLQWLDPTSMELLQTLVSRVGSRKALLLLTCRSSFRPPWSAHANELHLPLHPLTPSEAQRLVQAIGAERTPGDELMREVLAKSDGVPLFLEEVTRMLVDAPGGIESVPQNLRELLSARLDQLPPRALDTLRLASVAGRRFSRQLLLAVGEKRAEVVDQDLDVLVASDIVFPEPDGYSFKHVLLRDAAYDRMLRGSRAALHERLARALLEHFPHVADTQPEVIAHHFTEAGEIAPAIREWTRAGARSLRNGAYLEAVRQFERALELRSQLTAATDEQRTLQAHEELRLRKDFGISLIATQGYTSPAVAANYGEALRLSSELGQREENIPIPILYGLWGTCLVRGDREATDQLAIHFERVRGSADPLARHVAEATLGARAFYRGAFREAMTHCQEAMDIYQPSHHYVLMRDYGYEGGLYSHSYGACLLCFMGYPDSGLAVINEVLDLSGSLGDPYAKAVALGFAACVARERREPSRAKALAADLLHVAGEHHFVWWLGIAHCLHGWARVVEGDVDGGSDEIRSGLAAWERTGAKVPGTYLRLNLIEAELAKGAVEAGLAEAASGLEQCRATIECYQEPEYHRLRGELLKRSGQHAEAACEMRRAFEGARQQGATWFELRAAMSLARLGWADGPVSGLTLLADVVARLPQGRDTAEFREAISLLPGGDASPLNYAR